MSKVWFGSLQNRLEERMEMPEPRVGMGVTEMMWSDRAPYEITEVIDERHLRIRKLDWTRIDNNGFSESQEYEYSTNENNLEIMIFKTKQGQWRERLGRNGLGCNRFVIGRAERYYDPCF